MDMNEIKSRYEFLKAMFQEGIDQFQSYKTNQSDLKAYRKLTRLSQSQMEELESMLDSQKDIHMIQEKYRIVSDSVGEFLRWVRKDIKEKNEI